MDQIVNGDDEDAASLRARLAEAERRREAAESDLGEVLRIIDSTLNVWQRTAGPLLARRGFVRREDDPPAQVV